MRNKINVKKAQLLVNLMFLATLLVWLVFDFMRVFASPFIPITHLFFFEGAAMFVLGLLFGTITKEPWWPLIFTTLISVTIYGVLFRGLLTLLGINLYLFGLFLLGHFLQRNKKIIKVETDD